MLFFIFFRAKKLFGLITVEVQTIEMISAFCACLKTDILQRYDDFTVIVLPSVNIKSILFPMPLWLTFSLGSLNNVKA